MADFTLDERSVDIVGVCVTTEQRFEFDAVVFVGKDVLVAILEAVLRGKAAFIDLFLLVDGNPHRVKLLHDQPFFLIAEQTHARRLHG